MSLGAGDIAFATELFSDIPDLTTRRMFGGLGIYSAGMIFALMRSDGHILIKAQDGPFADDLAAMGAAKWTYIRNNGTASSMPYWSLPDGAVDDPDLVTQLAYRALAVLS